MISVVCITSTSGVVLTERPTCVHTVPSTHQEQAMRVLKRNLASIGAFERTASRYWTSDRIGWLRAQDDPLAPNRPGVAPLLRVLGLLGSDASLSQDKHRKYRQLNNFFEALEHSLSGPLQDGRSSPLRLVDLCTGASSHLALLLSFASRHRWERAVQVLAVDESAARLKSAQQRADLLGFGPDTLRFVAGRVASLDEWTTLHADAFGRAAPSAAGAGTPAAVGPPHGVFALHACDTATDEAIAFAVRSRARSLLVAPCCQAYGPLALKRCRHPHPDPILIVSVTRTRT